MGSFRIIIYSFCYSSWTCGGICSDTSCTYNISIVVPSSLGSNRAHISRHGKSTSFEACI